MKSLKVYTQFLGLGYMLEFPYIQAIYIYIYKFMGCQFCGARWNCLVLYRNNTCMESHLLHSPVMSDMLEVTHEADTRLSFYRNHKKKVCRRACAGLHLIITWSEDRGEHYSRAKGFSISTITEQLENAFKLSNTALLGKPVRSKPVKSKKHK